MKKRAAFAIIVFLCFCRLQAQNVIAEKNSAGAFTIVSANSATPIYIDKNDHAVVGKAAGFLQKDIEMLSGKKTSTLHDASSKPGKHSG